jgi:hypothetical protein
MQEEIDVDDYRGDDEEEEEEQQQACCSACMDCLGLSWRDFM